MSKANKCKCGSTLFRVKPSLFNGFKKPKMVCAARGCPEKKTTMKKKIQLELTQSEVIDLELLRKWTLETKGYFTHNNIIPYDGSDSVRSFKRGLQAFDKILEAVT